MNTCINKKRKAENAIVKKERKKERDSDRQRENAIIHAYIKIYKN